MQDQGTCWNAIQAVFHLHGLTTHTASHLPHLYRSTPKNWNPQWNLNYIRENSVHKALSLTRGQNNELQSTFYACRLHINSPQYACKVQFRDKAITMPSNQLIRICSLSINISLGMRKTTMYLGTVPVYAIFTSSIWKERNSAIYNLTSVSLPTNCGHNYT